jgi:phosphotransferase system HPr (HPr) family protein
MIKKKFVLKNKTGLHARPAAIFVQTSNNFKSSINVCCNERKADAKSILSVLTLGAEMDMEIVIEINGSDEKEALQALAKLIENKFGEE